MTDQEIMERLVKNEQEIIKLKDEIHRLRAEIDRLKRQDEKKENKYSGREPLMICGDSMSIRVIKRAYRKHVVGDDSIGWDELSEELGTSLAQIMGDKEFCDWLESLK